jgi:hypothetical protein
MAINLTINGTTYAYPEQGDDDWGVEATDWAAAVTSGMLQKAGGTFQLLAEVDFGTGFGLKSLYYKSRTANVASAGIVRLARVDTISWRNEANSADLDLSVDASDNLLFNGAPINFITAVSDTSTIDLTLTGTTLSADIVSGSITNSLISNSAAIALSKLAALTGDRAVQTNVSGILEVSATTSTELGYVSGVTSSIQNQLNGKQATGNYITALTGDVVATGPGSVTATIQAGVITNSMINNSAAIAYSKLAALTINRALVSDGSGVVSVATTTATEIGYVNGVTSSIQTQLNDRVVGPASSTDEAIARFDLATGKLLQNSVVTVSDAGVVSGITQLNVDNLRLDGNTLSSTNTNGNVVISPDGSGVVQVPLNKGLLLSDDDSSAGVTVKVPSALTSSWTLTLPDNDGSSGQYLQTNGSGVTSWQTVNASLGTVSAQNNNFTISDTDGIYLVAMTTGSGTPTVDLPTAADNTNRIISLKKVDTASGTATLRGESGQLIDDVNTKLLSMPYESITVICDGSKWFVTDRYYGITVTETWTDDQTNATTSVNVSREGSYVVVTGIMSFTGAVTGGEVNLTIPTRYTASSVYQAGTFRPKIGDITMNDLSAPYFGAAALTSTTNIRMYAANDGSAANINATNPFTWANGDSITFNLKWIVSGW